MKMFTGVAFVALLAAVAAMPISPAAPEYQSLVEELRSEGKSEQDITEQLSTPIDEVESRHPFYSQAIGKLYSMLHSPSEMRKRDLSGDIAPGTLDAPQMLPRAAAPESLTETITAVLRGEDMGRREFGYEGKESEMRRPEGMRHWGQEGRVFALF